MGIFDWHAIKPLLRHTPLTPGESGFILQFTDRVSHRSAMLSRKAAFLLVWIAAALVTSSTSCPKPCRCENGKARCSNEGLSQFPPLKDFAQNTTDIDLSLNQIQSIPYDVFLRLKELTKLKLSHNKITNVPRFPAPQSSNLLVLSLNYNNIRKIDDGAFDDLKKLSILDLSENQLEQFPVFNRTSRVEKLDLDSNPGITSLSKSSLKNLPVLTELKMKRTGVRELPDFIFSNNNRLSTLNLMNSALEKIEEKAFVGTVDLRDLYLNNTKITSLSPQGLRNLRRLHLSGIQNFWTIEPGFFGIAEVTVSDYNSYLCCAFYLKLYKRDHASAPVSRVPHRPFTRDSITTSIVTTIATFLPWVTHSTPASSTSSDTSTSAPNSTMAPTITTTEDDGWGRVRRGLSTTPGGVDGGFAERDFLPGTTSPTNQTTASTKSNHGWPTGILTDAVTVPTVIPHVNKTNASVHTGPPLQDVVCRPASDAFHPCEDLMGAAWLSALCFMVGCAALVANLVVILVILLSEKRFNVTKFLMCNLACADFALGLYLFILVCVSLNTSGHYYNLVRSWQYGAGCKVAGFLAVFSTELSVYSLALITIERFMAIAYAMQRNLRLSLRKAAKAMAAGWLFALLMATLPLVGVNSYEKVAICLPFDVTTTSALVYVTSLLVINGVVFLGVAGMYVKMFMVVAVGPGHMDGGGPQRNDAQVAKRMAVLVATDFVCWAPIAAFGLLAAFGQDALDLTQSKILLVFFFPLNSVCNPFLYAFFTKAFKREFYSLLSRCGFCKTRALRYKGTFSSLMYSRSRTKRSTVVDEDGERKSKRPISTSYSETRLSVLSFTGDGMASVPYPLIENDGVSMTAFGNLAFEANPKDDVFLSGGQSPKCSRESNQAVGNGHVTGELRGTPNEFPALPENGKNPTQGKSSKKVSVTFKGDDEIVTGV